MGRSNRLKQRQALSKGGESVTGREHDIMIVLADIIEATPRGQRTDAMSAMLSDVRAAQTAFPE